MDFLSPIFPTFLGLVWLGYWRLPSLRARNLWLLAVSYVFYGWTMTWACGLLAGSTLVDYGAARAMGRWPDRKRWFLVLSLLVNLGILAIFKYAGFFVHNASAALALLGVEITPGQLAIALPVGISFYTFQSMSYTIDVYRGALSPRRSLLDMALYVALFPQLVAGPIERAGQILPQVEAPRPWSAALLHGAWPLILGGYVKKLVVADSVAPWVDAIFAHPAPPVALLAAGAVGFAIQIYADFSAYTDIARGVARLFGFELMENFRAPYLATTPSDFWRRWHISLSTWIRDYLYVPLGGSRGGWARRSAVAILALGLSGLWHGAAWNFVAWGLYHGLLLVAYRALGMGGRWRPSSRIAWVGAWLAMLGWTLLGWTLFRAPGLSWLLAAVGAPLVSRGEAADGLGGWIGGAEDRVAAAAALGMSALAATPLLILAVLRRLEDPASKSQAVEDREREELEREGGTEAGPQAGPAARIGAFCPPCDPCSKPPPTVSAKRPGGTSVWRLRLRYAWVLRGIGYGLLAVLVVLFGSGGGRDFIYFRF